VKVREAVENKDKLTVPGWMERRIHFGADCAARRRRIAAVRVRWLSADLRLWTEWDLRGADGRYSGLHHEINVRAVGKSRTSDKPISSAINRGVTIVIGDAIKLVISKRTVITLTLNDRNYSVSNNSFIKSGELKPLHSSREAISASIFRGVNS